MKREILFRGKRVDNGEWVQGYYCHFENFAVKDVIYSDGNLYKEVIPETVGQFTGLTDKNGVKIFEDDVLIEWGTDYEKWREDDYEGVEPFKIIKKDIATMDRFPIYWLKNESFGYEGEDLASANDWEVIGIIHDNPELLK